MAGIKTPRGYRKMEGHEIVRPGDRCMGSEGRKWQPAELSIGDSVKSWPLWFIRKKAKAELESPVKVLHLNLKRCYFDQIKAGTKQYEYRLATKYWKKRICRQWFDEVYLLKGYPKRGDETRILRRRWNGYRPMRIKHKHFGPRTVRVLAIDVSKLLK